MGEEGLHRGHRRRLRERANKHPDSLRDDEVLELLLFGVLPRRDVKPLAKKLLEKFGGLGRLLHAENAQLAEFLGPTGIGMITAIRELTGRLSRPQPKKDKMLASWSKLLKYCRDNMGNRQLEELRLLMFDGKNYLISAEVVQTGTVDQVIINHREILKRALLANASAIILVHNHPGGDTEPSRADIKITLDLKELVEKSGVKLHDHVIISKDGHFSMRNEGLLDF